MQFIDLSHTISPDMPVYPGTEQPVLKTGCSIEEDGFLEKKITFYSHTGTHMDAPVHLIKNAKTLNQLPISHFCGSAVSINLDGIIETRIELKHIQPFGDTIKESDFVLIHTGWSQYWGTQSYFSQYPVLTLEAAQWLSEFDLKGIGLDTISADTDTTQDYPVHKIFLEKDIIIIENLIQLDQLPGEPFHLACFPLKFESADGSPIRAVAIIEESSKKQL